MTGEVLGQCLIDHGLWPERIDVISCSQTPGPARQDLANKMGVPVRGTMGRTTIREDGNQRIWDEEKTAANGNPDDRKNYAYHPKGEGYILYTPDD